MPLIRPARHGGRPRKVDVREVLNAVFYVLSTGCQWQALPKVLPPKSSVRDYFSRWAWEGAIERIHHALYVAIREQAGREASPTTAIIDSQTAIPVLGFHFPFPGVGRLLKTAAGYAWVPAGWQF